MSFVSLRVALVGRLVSSSRVASRRVVVCREGGVLVTRMVLDLDLDDTSQRCVRRVRVFLTNAGCTMRRGVRQTGKHVSMRGVSGCLVVCFWFTFARAEMVDSAGLK